MNILRYSPFWDVTQGRLVVTDVSKQPVAPIVRCKTVQVEYIAYIFLNKSVSMTKQRDGVMR